MNLHDRILETLVRLQAEGLIPCLDNVFVEGAEIYLQYDGLDFARNRQVGAPRFLVGVKVWERSKASLVALVGSVLYDTDKTSSTEDFSIFAGALMACEGFFAKFFLGQGGLRAAVDVVIPGDITEQSLYLLVHEGVRRLIADSLRWQLNAWKAKAVEVLGEDEAKSATVLRLQMIDALVGENPLGQETNEDVQTAETARVM